MIYIANAFSVQMLDRDSCPDLGRPVEFVPCSASFAREHLDEEGPWVGAIGHADTAAIAAGQLGLQPEQVFGRVSVSFKDGDTLLLAQYRGPRLPEGSTTLPEGAKIEWWLVQ